MNDQSNEDGSNNVKRSKAVSKKSSGKQSPASIARFHFTIEAANPEINVTVAPVNLTLPAPPWPEWPKPEPGP